MAEPKNRVGLPCWKGLRPDSRAADHGWIEYDSVTLRPPGYQRCAVYLRKGRPRLTGEDTTHLQLVGMWWPDTGEGPEYFMEEEREVAPGSKPWWGLHGEWVEQGLRRCLQRLDEKWPDAEPYDEDVHYDLFA